MNKCSARMRNILSLIVNDAIKFTDCLEQYIADHHHQSDVISDFLFV